MRTLPCIFLFLFTVVHAERCATPDSKEGQCINIEDCPALEGLDSPPWTAEKITLLQRSQCGYNGTSPRVCCQSSETPLPFKLPLQKPVVDLSNRFGDDEKCGIQYSSDRIFDGTITELHEFPWMALLVYQTPKGGAAVACGGVLVNHKYVLTAGHCVKGADVDKIGKLFMVRLGEWDLRSAEDCDMTASAIEDNCAPSPVDAVIESTHAHPDYRPGTNDRINDIALIRLQSHVTYSEYIQPICLPSNAHKNILNTAGNQLLICGWGKTETQEGSPIKLKAKIPLVAHEKCKGSYETRGIHLRSSQVCAGGAKKDSCKGDSGGPLLYEDKSNPHESRFYAVGVISFGPKVCGNIGDFAVYTRVTSYLDWIKSVIKS